MDLNNLTAADRNKLYSGTNKGGIPSHITGSVAATPIDVINLDSYTSQIHINNTHATQSLLVSFDGGVNWFTIFAKTTLTLDTLTCNNLQVKGSGSATTYEILYTI